LNPKVHYRVHKSPLSETLCDEDPSPDPRVYKVRYMLGR